MSSGKFLRAESDCIVGKKRLLERCLCQAIRYREEDVRA